MKHLLEHTHTRESSRIPSDTNASDSHSIPNEILLKIFEKLDYEDLVSVSMVSRRFWILAQDPGLWKRIYASLHQTLNETSPEKTGKWKECVVDYVKRRRKDRLLDRLIWAGQDEDLIRRIMALHQSSQAFAAAHFPNAGNGAFAFRSHCEQCRLEQRFWADLTVSSPDSSYISTSPFDREAPMWILGDDRSVMGVEGLMSPSSATSTTRRSIGVSARPVLQATRYRSLRINDSNSTNSSLESESSGALSQSVPRHPSGIPLSPTRTSPNRPSTSVPSSVFTFPQTTSQIGSRASALQHTLGDGCALTEGFNRLSVGSPSTSISPSSALSNMFSRSPMMSSSPSSTTSQIPFSIRRMTGSSTSMSVTTPTLKSIPRPFLLWTQDSFDNTVEMFPFDA